MRILRQTTPSNLQKHPATKPKECVLVLGAARSGTSMVAGVVSCLGIPTHRAPGESESEPSGFWGDRYFTKTIDQLYHIPNNSILRRYFHRHQVWGLKAHGFRNIELMKWVIDNVPLRIIYTRRSVKSIRRSMIRKRNIETGAFNRKVIVKRVVTTMLRVRRVRQMVHATNPPMHPIIGVDTKKLVRNTRTVVEEIATFLGVSDQSRIDQAVNFIQPEFWHY